MTVKFEMNGWMKGEIAGGRQHRADLEHPDFIYTFEDAVSITRVPNSEGYVIVTRNDWGEIRVEKLEWYFILECVLP